MPAGPAHPRRRPLGPLRAEEQRLEPGLRGGPASPTSARAPIFKVTRSRAHEHGPESVAYPNIYTGCSYDTCDHGGLLPTRVFRMRHPWVSWFAHLTRRGRWDANLDMWLSRREQKTGIVTGAEVMTWINTRGLGTPAGQHQDRRYPLAPGPLDHQVADRPQHYVAADHLPRRPRPWQRQAPGPAAVLPQAQADGPGAQRLLARLGARGLRDLERRPRHEAPVVPHPRRAPPRPPQPPQPPPPVVIARRLRAEAGLTPLVGATILTTAATVSTRSHATGSAT